MPDNVIVYQGHEGAYSHLACRHVHPEMEARPCSSFVAAMMEVEQGLAALAMIPLENSTAGRVEEIYRQMPKTKLHIVGEHFEPVNHCLLGVRGSTLAGLKTVGSHPQALAQCHDRIKSLKLEPIAKLDTAGAALEVSERGDPSHCAIASRLAAELYDLDVLQENVQDVVGNTTRFLILSATRRMPVYQAGQDYITSMMFKVRNIPAALYKALGGFATNNVNLLKLESYMAGGTLRESTFHLDAAAHPDQRSMQLALQELEFFGVDIRILGTYPAHPFRHNHELIE